METVEEQRSNYLNDFLIPASSKGLRKFTGNYYIRKGLEYTGRSDMSKDIAYTLERCLKKEKDVLISERYNRSYTINCWLVKQIPIQEVWPCWDNISGDFKKINSLDEVKNLVELAANKSGFYFVY